MTVRELDRGDREAVVTFFGSLGEEGTRFFNYNSGNLNRTLEYLDGRRPGHIFFGAFEDGAMAGILFLWDLDRSVVWLGVGVAEAFRGRRIGYALMDFASEYCRGRGYGGILLDTAVENTAARRLYESRGYERIGTHPSGELLYLLRFPARKTAELPKGV